MTRKEKRFFLLLFCLVPGFARGAEEPASAWVLSGNGAEQSKIENGKAPGEKTRNVLKLTYCFPEKHKGGKALFLNLKKPLEIQSGEEELSLHVHSDAPGHRLYFECTDRDGETLLFSWRDPKHFRTLDQRNWQEFRLIPEKDERTHGEERSRTGKRIFPSG